MHSTSKQEWMRLFYKLFTILQSAYYNYVYKYLRSVDGIFFLENSALEVKQTR